jgi:hypothetical protein
VTLSLPWRSVWRSKGVDEEPLEPAHHMEAYAEVLKYFHQLNMNCQKAMKMYPIKYRDTTTFLVSDDVLRTTKRMSLSLVNKFYVWRKDIKREIIADFGVFDLMAVPIIVPTSRYDGFLNRK